MKRRTLLISGLIALGIAGSAVAGGLHARWMARQAMAPTAQSLGLDANQSAAFNELQERQGEFRRAAHAAIGTLIADAHDELSKDSADLAVLSAEVDRTLLALVIENRSLKTERMAFYQTLTPQQKSQLHQAMLERVERLQRLHATIGDFLQERS